ncbi:MAG: efflux RND transporter periplasmic adaptor subunit [Deltaproteobacteria bacterium]|nr:MAG: efflux RND transporter periplasmic adaptor subunit [Deltaproteobacteria bacterium]
MTDRPSNPLAGALGRALVLLVVAVLAFAAGALLTGGGSDATGVEHAEETVWTCSMHPQIRQPDPGSCPICGMDLIPAGRSDAASAEDVVVLSERARTLAQLRTEPVRRQGAAAEVRLLGRVEVDESTQKTVTAWIDGRIDRLSVNTTGERVRAGQVIATLYSPEVYAAHQDLLTAREQVERLGDGTATAASAARAALQAAKDRLHLLGVPKDEVERMASADEPLRAVAIRSPFSGTVIERMASEGSYVKTGAALYRVADLRKLWIELDAYESDLARIEVGQEVQLEIEALPGQRFEGKVSFVDPTLDPRLRTAAVRVELANADGALRPGMFAEATVFTGGDVTGEAPLVIPASAPLFTGKRSVVYVEQTDGEGVAYAPRTVRLGPRLGEVYPVVAGLSEGERVVTRGAFALDADLQIRGGPSMMTLSDDESEGPYSEVIELPAESRARLAPVLRTYLEVQVALADDDLDAAKGAADRLAAAVTDVELSAGQEAWSALATELRGHATHVARAKDLQGARGGFEPLSTAIEATLRSFGNPLDTDIHVAFCPMADNNQGARWIQQGESIDNSYFGASMLRCGEIKAEVPPGAFLPRASGAAPRPAPAGHVH